jgi:hypothetical protein
MTKYLLLFDNYSLVIVGRPLWREERAWTYSKRISHDRYAANLLGRRSDLQKTHVTWSLSTVVTSRRTRKTQLFLLLRNQAKGYSARICLCGNYFTNTLPSNGCTCKYAMNTERARGKLEVIQNCCKKTGNGRDQLEILNITRGQWKAGVLTVMDLLSFVKCGVLVVYLRDYMILKMNLFHEIGYICSYKKDAIILQLSGVIQRSLK